MSTLWHPHARRKDLPDAGTFTGGGWKFVVHTTEGGTGNADAMWEVLREKNAAPHFILGVDTKGHRQLIQCIPLNRAGRALVHSGGPETNRANAIQVEVCEMAAHAQKWDPKLYEYLHDLMVFTHHHAKVPMAAHHPFIGQHGYHRLSGGGWVGTEGLVGHCHCPENDHVDPGNLQIGKVLGHG